jgi:hypothetical protein
MAVSFIKFLFFQRWACNFFHMFVNQILQNGAELIKGSFTRQIGGECELVLI